MLRFLGGLLLMLSLLALVGGSAVAQDRPGATPVAEPLGGIELTKTFDPPFIPTAGNTACFRVAGSTATEEMCLDADDATTPGDFSSYTIQINELPAGYYFLTEYDTPDGYFSDQPYGSIRVNPGEESAVTINNSTTPYRGAIRVSKRVCAVTPDGVTAANADGPICPGDEATDPTAAGTEFAFTVHQGHEDTSSSSAPVQTIAVTIDQTGYGSATSQSLPQGQYTVCERETPGFQAAPRPNFLGEYVPGQPCLRMVVSPNGESTAFFANFRVAVTDPDPEPTTETPDAPTAPKPTVTATEEATTIARQRNGRDDEQDPSGDAVVSTTSATPTTTTTPQTTTTQQTTQPVPTAVTVLPNTGGGVVDDGSNPRALLVLASLSGLLIAGAVWQIRRSAC
jgi:hypothetical protein